MSIKPILFSIVLLPCFIIPVKAADPEAGHPKAPQDLEVCFSPEGQCDEKLAAFIDEAKKTIDIAIYDITLVQLVHQLNVKALSDGVKIRILVDRRQAHGKYSLVSTLVKAKNQFPKMDLAVRYGSQRGIMHNKFTIIDDRMVETGSFNYTEGATASNNENQIYIADQDVVTTYRKRFETLWAKGKEVKVDDFKSEK